MNRARTGENLGVQQFRVGPLEIALDRNLALQKDMSDLVLQRMNPREYIGLKTSSQRISRKQSSGRTAIVPTLLESFSKQITRTTYTIMVVTFKLNSNEL